MIGLSRIWEVSWDTHRTFLECKRLHIQCQFQEPSQILQHCFFNVFSKEHNWITLQGWCHNISCWPSSADLSTNRHRPNQHHVKIALFEWFCNVCGWKHVVAGRVFRFLRCIKVSISILYTPVSVRRITSRLATQFFPIEHDWITLQRMVCQHTRLIFQFGSKQKPPQTWSPSSQNGNLILQCRLKTCGDLEVFSDIMFVLFKILAASSTNRTPTCKRSTVLVPSTPLQI